MSYPPAYPLIYPLAHPGMDVYENEGQLFFKDLSAMRREKRMARACPALPRKGPLGLLRRVMLRRAVLGCAVLCRAVPQCDSLLGWR